MPVAALLLAAGASSRMGALGPKALLDYRGETFFARLQRILAAHCDPVVAVLGYHAESLLPLVRPAVTAAMNPHPELGMLSSLQTGLRALPPGDQPVLFLPLDYPAVDATTIESVVAAAPSAPLVIPRYRGERGHPVRISRAIAAQLLALDPASGAQARDVIRAHYPQVTYVEVDDPAILMDVDTPEDYRALQMRR